MRNSQPLFALYVKAGFLLVVLSSIFQFFIFNIGGIYISVFYLSSLLMLPIAIIQIKVLAWRPIFFFAIFICIQLASLLWSVDVILGVKYILNELFFIIILLLSIYVCHNNFIFFKKSMILFFLMLLIPGVLVIIFRLFPIIELGFLNSDLANIFINPNSLSAFFGDSPNNVFDESKAGGFFINANPAAAYLGISGFSALALVRLFESKMLGVIGVILITCSLFTGSKAAVLISFLFILLILKKSKYSVFIFPLLAAAASTLMFLLIEYIDVFKEDVIETSAIRFLIWGHFFNVFFETPILGQGFGNWAISFKNYAASFGIADAYPPHNTFISIWSESGVVALFALLIFYFYLFRTIGKLKRLTNKRATAAADALMYCLLWTILHGQGENFGPLGELHMFPLFAILISISYSTFESLKHENSYIQKSIV